MLTVCLYLSHSIAAQDFLPYSVQLFNSRIYQKLPVCHLLTHKLEQPIVYFLLWHSLEQSIKISLKVWMITLFGFSLPFCRSEKFFPDMFYPWPTLVIKRKGKHAMHKMCISFSIWGNFHMMKESDETSEEKKKKF